jgi:hypothetical protein
MANKTKAELMDEIKAKNDEIKNLKKEIEKLDRYKVYEEAANELAAIRESYINAGFDKAEAFELSKMMMQLAASTLFKLR